MELLIHSTYFGEYREESYLESFLEKTTSIWHAMAHIHRCTCVRQRQI